MDKKLTQAIQLSKSGDKDTARLLLREIVDETPETLAAWFWLADAMPDDGSRIGVLEEAVGHYPEEKRLTTALARLIAERKPAGSEGTEAVADTKVEIDSDPAHAAKEYDPFISLGDFTSEVPAEEFFSDEEPTPESHEFDIEKDIQLVKKRRTVNNGSLFVLLVLVFAAVAVGWYFRDALLEMLRPTAVPAAAMVTATAEAPASEPSHTAQPAATKTIAPSATTPQSTATQAVASSEGTATPIIIVTPTNTAVVEEGIFVPVPGSRVNDITWSQDGSLFAIAGDGGIMIYDGKSFLAKIRINLDPPVPVSTISFSPDNQYIAAGFDQANSGEDFITRAKMWKVNDGAEVMSFDYNDSRGDIDALAFSTDGETLLMNAKLDVVLKWRVSDGALLDVFRLSESAVNYYGVVFSPDRLSFATFSKFDRVRLYDTLFGEETAVLGESKDITNAVFSRSNQYLAVMFENQPYVYLWDLPSKEKIKEWNTFGGNVTTLAFNADNQTLAIGTDEDLIKFYQIRSGEEQRVISRQIPGVMEMEFAPDDIHFAVRNGTEVQVWNLLTDTLVATFRVVGD